MSGLLVKSGYEPITVDNLEAAKEAVPQLPPGAVVVAAMKFAHGTAQELVNWQKQEGYKFPVIAVVDNLNPLEIAEVMKDGGAVDIIQRPAIDKQLLEKVGKYANPESVVVQLDNVLIPRRSAKFREIERTIGRIADTNANCIIFGESGMGKEQIARQIYLQSFRTQKPITAIEAGGAELVGLHDDIRQRIAEVTVGDNEIPELEREMRRIARELKIKADELTSSRIKCAESFSRLLCDTARPLGLANINFRAEVCGRKLCVTGQDEIEFLCSFNKNGTPKPIGEIASGGEIARMMLSLKSILAGHINLPTIIFDEVDTGVSGEIADKMGDMMHDVSESMQVVVITHLPQVAAKGDAHFKVYKTDADTRTVTHVRQLTVDDRIRELAAMISGSEVSEAALSAARALLKR